MASINAVAVVGRTTKDIEVRSTNSGKPVVSFTLAVNSYGKDAEANFIDCVAWNQAAELLAQFGAKGKQIGVTGRLQTRSYEDREGNKRKATEIVVDQFELFGNKEDKSKPMTQAQALNGGKDVVLEDIDTESPIDLSEIPF